MHQLAGGQTEACALDIVLYGLVKLLMQTNFNTAGMDFFANEIFIKPSGINQIMHPPIFKFIFSETYQ